MILLKSETEYYSEALYPMAVQVECDKLYKMKLGYIYKMGLLINERLNLNLLITEARLDPKIIVEEESMDANHKTNQEQARTNTCKPKLPPIDRRNGKNGGIAISKKILRILPSGPIYLEEAKTEIENLTVEINKLEANIYFITSKIEGLEKLLKEVALNTSPKSVVNLASDIHSKENADILIAPMKAEQIIKANFDKTIAEKSKAIHMNGNGHPHSRFSEVIFTYKPNENTQIEDAVISSAHTGSDLQSPRLQSPRKYRLDLTDPN